MGVMKDLFDRSKIEPYLGRTVIIQHIDYNVPTLRVVIGRLDCLFEDGMVVLIHNRTPWDVRFRELEGSPIEQQLWLKARKDYPEIMGRFFRNVHPGVYVEVLPNETPSHTVVV